MIRYRWSNGGRLSAGFPAIIGCRDCVARSIAIVTGRRYYDVWHDLARRQQAVIWSGCETLGGAPLCSRDERLPSPDTGVVDDVSDAYLSDAGYSFHSMPGGGLSDVPASGRYIVMSETHATAVVDGVVMDVWDCRGMEITGYWSRT